MAFTGRLGTSNSQLGQIELGALGETVIAPALLGPGQIFSPTITSAEQTVSPGLLGPGVLFAPTISQPIAPDLLGPAQIFAPIRIDQQIRPDKIGLASIFTPAVKRTVTGSFRADAIILGQTRLQHNRFTEHSGVDNDIAHALAATIGVAYWRGFPLEELLREIDRRITILENGESQYDRWFFTFTADAVIQNTASFSFTADAVIGAVPPISVLGGYQLFDPLVGVPGVVAPALLGGAQIRDFSINRVAPSKLGGVQIYEFTIRDVYPPLLGGAIIRPPRVLT